MQFLLPKIQLFRRRSEIYLAEPGSYLLERLSSTLLESNIFRPEDSMPSAWEKFSTSSRRMQCLLGKIRLSCRRIVICQADSGSFLLERHSSILAETTISRPEDYILSALEKFSSSGRRMIQLSGRNFQILAGGFIDSQLLSGECISSVKCSNFLVGSVALASTQRLKIWL